MRAPPPPTSHARAHPAECRPWLAMALLWSIAAGPVAADDTADNKASRLGFKFDQQAHAAAAASKAAAGSAETAAPGVVVLPRHVVTGRRVAIGPDEGLTPKGRVEVAERRYESPLYRAVIGPLAAVASFLHDPLRGWNPNAPEALALYEQDQQLRRDSEMSDLRALAALADTAQPPADTGGKSRKTSP